MKIFRKIVISAILISCIIFGESNIENKIAQIRKDYISTNAVKNYVVKEIENSEKSTDGGAIKYYSESWNSLIEYYIKNGKVYFIYDRTQKYNVPYYINANWYKENNLKVGEVFNSKKSKITEKRYYFDENEKLIQYIIGNKRIDENIQKLKEIEKNVLDEYFRIKNKN